MTNSNDSLNDSWASCLEVWADFIEESLQMQPEKVMQHCVAQHIRRSPGSLVKGCADDLRRIAREIDNA